MLSVDIGHETWYDFPDISEPDRRSNFFLLAFVEDTVNVYSFVESQRLQAVDQLQAYYRLTDVPCRWIAVVDVTGFRNPETLYGMTDPELYRRKEG